MADVRRSTADEGSKPEPDAREDAGPPHEEARPLQPPAPRPREINGRGGLDPARYGDWEVKGLASDF